MALPYIIKELNKPTYSEPIEVTSSVISLPDTVSDVKGQVSVSLKGNTVTNECVIRGTGVSVNQATKTARTRSSSEKIYLLPETAIEQEYIIHFTATNLLAFGNHWLTGFRNLDTPMFSATQFEANEVKTFTFIQTLSKDARLYSNFGSQDMQISNVMIVRKQVGDEILTTAQLREKYRFHDSSKSTVSHRYSSVGKNLFDKGKGIVQGQYLNSSGGLTTNSSYWYDTKYIKVYPNTQYIKNDAFSIVFYDINKQFISYGGLKTFVTPLNCAYVRLSSTISLLETYQFELGSINTPYEPFKDGGKMYVPSVGGSVGSSKDEIRPSQNGYEHIKRNNVKVVVGESASGGTVITTETTYRLQLLGWITQNNAFLSGFNYNAQAVNNEGIFNNVAGNPGISASFSVNTMSLYDTSLFLYIPKTKIDAMTGATTLDKFKAYLNQFPITVIYQLMSEVRTPLGHMDILRAYKNGTIFVEPFIREEEIYSATGIAINNPTLPIKSIESVWKVQGSTYIPVDMTKVVFTQGATTFTITGAIAGEKYRYDYEYPSELTTLPSITYSFPLNIAANLSQINDLQERLSKEIGNIWFSLLPVAEKELAMYVIQSINTAEPTTTEIKDKINQIINVWKS